MSLKHILQQINFQLLAVGRDKPTSWWSYKQVCSDYSRLYLITEGKAQITQNGVTHQLTPGSLHLIPKGTFFDLHSQHYHGELFCCFNVTIGDEHSLFDHISTSAYTIQNKLCEQPTFERLIDLFPKQGLVMYNPYLQLTSGDKGLRTKDLELADGLEVEGLLKMLLLPFLTTASLKTEACHFSIKIAKVRDYIDSIPIKRVERAELAKISEMTPETLSNQFKKGMGLPLKTYIMNRRFKESTRLLLGTKLTIEEIAVKSGFSNDVGLIRFFKRRVNVTPTEFRKLYGN